MNMTKRTMDTIERHLAAVDDELHEAIRDSEYFRDVASNPEFSPKERGRAGAHEDLATSRWTKALGARAALEALYQELSGGEPSPSAAQANKILEDAGVATNPVGLQGREVHRLDVHESATPSR